MMQVGLVLSWLVYQKTLLYLGKIMVFLRRSLFHFTHWNSFLHSGNLLSLPIYVWQPRYWPQCRQTAELSGRLSSFSITDALSCINVQCFCMVCCVIVKLISYLFTGSPNACANYIEYISFVLILHIIYTKYIIV